MVRTRTAILWLIVALFAIFNVVSSVVPSLVPPGLIAVINTVLLVGFALLHGSTRYGVNGILVFALVCLITSNIFENVSILTGFPFGHYHYTQVLGPKLFLVPITIGGAYFGAGYLSWTMALVLLGRRDRVFDRYAQWAVPAIASFLMASWDFMLDPAASTVDRYWVWERGGGFFGVPFSNYMGWLLTVFTFFFLFSAYVRRQVPTTTAMPQPLGARFWAQPILMYALLAIHYVFAYFIRSDDARVVDAAGHSWMLHDIFETAALAAVFTIFAFSLIAAIRLADKQPLA